MLIILLPINKRSKYIGLENDCSNHAIWIYDRLFNNAKPVDIAFLGSSHTLNSINDKLIEDKLKKSHLNVVNFGYCRLGRNLTYIFIKELLKTKNPKYLIIEVREDESRFSHPIFPYISGSRNVLLPVPFINRSLLKDIWTHLAYKIELTQEALFQKTPIVPIKTEDYGYFNSQDTASLEILNEYKAKRSVNVSKLTTIDRGLQMRFPRSYLKKIKTLCEEQNIKVSFLYLPSYGTYLEKPKETNTYQKLGRLYIPPKEILETTSNWRDQDHLNESGARKLSLWMAQKIKEEIALK